MSGEGSEDEAGGQLSQIRPQLRSCGASEDFTEGWQDQISVLA